MIRNTTHSLAIVTLGVGLLGIPSNSIAAPQESAPTQEVGEGPDEVAAQPDIKATPEPTAAPTSDFVPRADFEALQQKVADLDEWREEREMTDLTEDLVAAHGSASPMRVFGFFDLHVNRVFIKNDNVLKGMFHENLAFTIPNVNIYFLNQLTPSIKTLIELHFTFLPQGQETYFPEYHVLTTHAIHPRTRQNYNLGGVMIERAQVTWQRWDWLGLTAGRFVTPFGIWNEEHGSPIIIPIMPPYIIMNETIPISQTGLQVHGTFFPFSNTSLRYGITISNNRGPLESMTDFSDNKAFGARLRLHYEGDVLEVALGGYGYWGHTREVEKTATSTMGISLETKETKSYNELSGALDFLISAYGIRLQAEHARSFIEYDTRPQRIANLLNIPIGGYLPNHVRWDSYVLLAYTLPFREEIGGVAITPFVLVEQSVMEDTSDDTYIWMLRGGLNVKPVPGIALKATVTRWEAPKSSIIESASWTVAGQMAVAF